MPRSLTIARKEFTDVLRERSILLAVLIQFFVAAFSGFLMVGLVALYDPENLSTGTPIRAAVVRPGLGFDHLLDGSPDVRVDRTSYEEAVDAFRAGRVEVVVEERADGDAGVRTITLLLPDSEVRTTIIVTKFRQLLEDYEKQLREERDDRIEATVVYVTAPGGASPYFGFAYSILLPLLILTPVFLAGSIAADSVTQEIETRTLELLRSSPAGPGEIFFGKMLTPVLLAPAQAFLWFLLLTYNGAPVHHILPLLLLTTCFAALFAGLSTILALQIKRQGETQLAYSLVVLFLFVVSLLLEQTPFNLIARLAIGAAGRAEAQAIALYLFATLAILLVAYNLSHRRLAAGAG